jgi:hypothetical protein
MNYQGVDPNIGRPGLLTFHRAVRYFLMLEDLREVKRSWETHELFNEFRLQVEKIDNENLHESDDPQDDPPSSQAQQAILT